MVTAMRLSIINLLLLFLLLLPDSAQARIKEDSLKMELRYQQQLEKYKSNWSKLIPHYTKIQFAGGMGMLSLGLGWDYGKKEQWETDLMLGFVPKFSNKKVNLSVTLKQNYIPWKVPIKNSSFSFEPFETGLYINKITADNFWAKEPDKYGGPYYRFATSVRFYLFVGQRWEIKLSKKIVHKSITLFYEASICDLYMVSILTNKYLNFSDVVSLSFGAKFKVF